MGRRRATLHLAAAILDAIDEPALIVRRGTVEAANQAAQSLLGQQIIGRDLRFAIRHLALDTILAARSPISSWSGRLG
jgi:two-component system phosphate regulon sensor histidine kinase PhoR